MSTVDGDPETALANHREVLSIGRARVGLVRWALVAVLLESAGVAAEAETPDLAEARRVGSEMAPHDAISYALQPHHELATAG